MEIFCGIPTTANAFFHTAQEINSPILVSANIFWNQKKQRFQGHEKLWECEVPLALDCGGFVAMKRYGGYRWNVMDYMELATWMRPIWWSAMDYCCEPEVAKDPLEVTARVEKTVYTLGETLASLIAWKRELPHWCPTTPMPVLQGWHPNDYLQCIRLMENEILKDSLSLEAGMDGWPELVGLGSVCRRHLKGPDGLLKIVEAIDKALPPHTKLHLFGVKSQAAEIFSDHPRIASIDSMAWNMTARWKAFKSGQSKTQTMLAKAMQNWVQKQRQRTQNPQLSFGI